MTKNLFMEANSTLKGGKAELTFERLPYGFYAAILYHDENNNGKLDHLFFMPNEPLAFTNDWRLSLFSGMPSFEKLKFRFSSDSSSYKIEIKCCRYITVTT